MSKTGFDPDRWIGRTWECPLTKERMTIGSDVKRGQFFTFGNCFVDVGDGFYARFGGNPVEIKENKK